MADKPRLLLLGPNPTVETILDFYRKLTGKEPTQAEIDDLKARAIMGEKHEDNQWSGGYNESPDADIANADWPKRTKDVKTPSVGS